MAKKIHHDVNNFKHLGILCFVATVISFLGIAYVSFICYVLAALLALMGLVKYKELADVDKPLLIISVALLVISVFQI